MVRIGRLFRSDPPCPGLLPREVIVERMIKTWPSFIWMTFSALPPASHSALPGIAASFLTETKLSRRHCSITISEKNRIIVRDWGSRNGTEVVYHGKPYCARMNCDWILNDIENHDNPELSLQLGPNLSFIIKMNTFRPTSDERARINEWRSGNDWALDRVEDLTFQSGPSTALHSQFRTPVPKDRILGKYLGHGSFGTAIHQFNTRTGEQFVKKIPKKLTGICLQDWRREAQVLKQISHVGLINFPLDNTSPNLTI